jgi:hypothetical protein
MSLSQGQLARDTSGVVGDKYCKGVSVSRFHPCTGRKTELTPQVKGQELLSIQSQRMPECRPG